MDANERRARATQEATQWWNRLAIQQPGDISKTDLEQYTEWLRESPLHVAELLRIAHVHDALERFKRWGEIEVGDAETPDNVVPLREKQDEPAESRSGISPAAAVHRPRVGLWAVAASICFVVLMAGWFVLGARGQIVETQLAERRQVMLDDGSLVSLEPETTLRVKFEARNRYVVLERGRALFRVAKDAQRPFWVDADRTSVRAVGTEFGVENASRGVIVTVAEGKVAVKRRQAGWSTDEHGQGAVTSGVENGGPGAGAVIEASASEIFLTAG